MGGTISMSGTVNLAGAAQVAVSIDNGGGFTFGTVTGQTWSVPSWDISAGTDGPAIITATAQASGGANLGSATVNVTVDNP